jgi:hypothetical protein
MSNIILILKSRTFWTVVAMFVIGGTNAVSSFIPTGLEPVVMLVLGGLATYFHINPSQNYAQ